MSAPFGHEGAAAVAAGTATPEDDDQRKHFHCYCLKSLDPSHPRKTYIGFTTDPHRRLRQHNGIRTGGAKRTRGGGRPWTFVVVVHGFPSKVSALRAEWAWQHPDCSRAVREALGWDDPEARKMHRRHGPRARLDVLRLIVCRCEPFNSYPLGAHFPERRHMDQFVGLLEQHGDTFPGGMTCEVRAVEQMPFWVERAEARERRKTAKRRTARKVGKNEKGVEVVEDLCPEDLMEAYVTSSSGSDGEEDRCIEHLCQEYLMEAPVSVGEADGSHENKGVGDQVAANPLTQESKDGPLVRCFLCSGPVTRDDVPATCPSCDVPAHFLCLADRLLEDAGAASSVLVPTEGCCPYCQGRIVWSDIVAERSRIRKRDGYLGGTGEGDDDDNTDCGADGFGRHNTNSDGDVIYVDDSSSCSEERSEGAAAAALIDVHENMFAQMAISTAGDVIDLTSPQAL